MGFVEPPEARRWRGILYLLVSCTGFGIAPSLARLAYDAGSEPATAILMRFTVATMVVTLTMRRLGRPLRLAAGDRRQAIGIGLLAALLSWGYLSAVALVPVSVAALVFFSFPGMVAVAAHLAGVERLTRLRSAALAAAFAGIALVVGFELGRTLDPAGLGLAFLAAVACAASILWTSRVLRRAEPLAVNAHAVLTATAASILVVAIGGGPAWPGTVVGWIGLGGASVVYAAGFTSLFFAVRLLGPVRVAALGNVEPVIAVSAAVAILGETVTPLQAAGVLVVLAALAALQWRESPGRAP
ncbi:DMT family transporter [Stella sp.]|uniref:DMT family transporter n=1 Tax=Stella sp. TaxID=2912054 RepID=UPI0035B34A9B